MSRQTATSRLSISKARKEVNPNLVKNGDFEYAPPFVAVQTASMWIDGTATGGNTDEKPTPIGWYGSIVNGATCQFDTSTSHSGTKSMKLSTPTTGDYAEIKYRSTYYAGINPENKIICQPNTSYTCTYWMKTEYTSGDSNNGAKVTIIEGDGLGTTGTNTSGTEIKTTTDWTQYTVTFTTASTANSLNLECRIYGHTGDADLIMDAWFDDIVLKPTTPVTRTAATGRTAC